LWRRLDRQLLGAGVEVEGLGIAAPLEVDVDLTLHLLLGETFPEQIEEMDEALTQRPVLRRAETAASGDPNVFFSCDTSMIDGAKRTTRRPRSERAG
jgi:hypothetical protein